MTFRQKITLSLLLLLSIALCLPLSAQQVEILDPNLRAAVRVALNLPDRVPITQTDMHQLTKLESQGKQIKDLSGLEHAVNITWIDFGDNQITSLSPLAVLTRLEVLKLGKNPISDLSPLAELTRLSTFYAWECQISDISPLANLIQLAYLDMSYNRIVDIGPLANLTRLIELVIRGNEITDVTALTNLTNLKVLWIQENNIVDIGPFINLTQLTELMMRGNYIADVTPLANLRNLEVLEIQENNIVDYTPLSALSLTRFLYDELCEIPSLPILNRLENRDYPSIFAFWGNILNRPHLSEIESGAMHDLVCCVDFGLYFHDTPEGITMAGSLERAIRERDKWLFFNPHIIFITEIRMRDAFPGYFPDDSPYWVRDANDKPISGWPGTYLINFTHPDVQEIIIQQAIAVSKCGLFDGIFFDYWADERAVLQGPGVVNSKEGYFGYETEQKARKNIIQRIRAETRSDFLIMGNTNRGTLPRTGAYINGGFMETLVPHLRSGNNLERNLTIAENSLLWLEQNLQEPQINSLEGWGVPTEAPDSPANLRWMRAITTLSFTHSDGYVLFTDGYGHDHYWYDFWDADLGRPVGPKAQLYDGDIPGLYIREFTNGWAVYNHSGESQEITLPEKVQGVASGVVNTEHTLPNLDGEMYLRAKPKNPADVNGDGVVNIFDLTLVAQAMGTDNRQGDVNGDGVINVFDLVFVANAF